MKIAIGSDHAGFELKKVLIQYLQEKDFFVQDLGTNSTERADYPDFGHAVATSITEGATDLGIIVCGSGNGINMSANKHEGIRSALCWNKEIACMAKAHNDANILALPARYIEVEEAKKCIDVFINTKFEGGRHANRVKKINL